MFRFTVNNELTGKKAGSDPRVFRTRGTPITAQRTMDSALTDGKRSRTDGPLHPGLCRLVTTEAPVIAAGWVNHQPAVGWLVACLTSQQHASVPQGRICSDSFTCCHTEIEVAGQTFHLTQSQYTDTGPTSPGTDPITPGAWQGSQWRSKY